MKSAALSSRSRSKINMGALVSAWRASLQPRNRTVRYRIAACDFAHGFALVAAFDRFASLMGGKFRLAAHLHATRHGAGSAFSGARADQLAFKLGQAA
jgi:hypothetical protein